jgi:hypothetical protein
VRALVVGPPVSLGRWLFRATPGLGFALALTNLGDQQALGFAGAAYASEQASDGVPVAAIWFGEDLFKLAGSGAESCF